MEAVLLGGRIQITLRYSLLRAIGQLTTSCRDAGCSVVKAITEIVLVAIDNQLGTTEVEGGSELFPLLVNHEVAANGCAIQLRAVDLTEVVALLVLALDGDADPISQLPFGALGTRGVSR